MLIFLLSIVWASQIIGTQIINNPGHLRLVLSGNSVLSQSHLEYSTSDNKAVLFVPGFTAQEEFLQDYQENGIRYIDLRNEEDALKIVIATDSLRSFRFANRDDETLLVELVAEGVVVEDPVLLPQKNKEDGQKKRIAIDARRQQPID